jgi:hypothetical protein
MRPSQTPSQAPSQSQSHSRLLISKDSGSRALSDFGTSQDAAAPSANTAHLDESAEARLGGPGSPFGPPCSSTQRPGIVRKYHASRHRATHRGIADVETLVAWSRIGQRPRSAGAGDDRCRARWASDVLLRPAASERHVLAFSGTHRSLILCG